MRAYFIYIKEARNLWDLASFLLSGKTTSYEYDINGRRTKKVANGVTTEYYYSGEQYTGMHTSDGKDVGAILDASGGLYGIYYDDSTIGTDVGQTYYFVYNGQGDVIGLYNHGGKLIATYAYDAWGRCIEAKAVTADDDGHAVTDPDHIAFINPFRYRGYMYDAESGLYYLQSRYYDPETGRFIHSDNAIPSTGESVQGYNLFAYCMNNPINMDDQNGNWPKWLKNAANAIGNAIGNVVKAVGEVVTQAKAVLSIPSTVAKITAASTVAVVSGEATVSDVVNDVKNYDFFNKDEQKCLDAKVFSSYKGTPVLKQDISGGSMSVSNTIFLSKSEWDVETVKHEWGHTVQQSLMGTPKFMARIAVPSLIGAGLGVDDYYSQPWERSADFFGGATHSYSENSGFWVGLYFIMP